MAKVNNLSLQYINHSGFLIETDNKQFVFDYYKGSVSLLDKKTYVFSSHAHLDHYNPQIFEWQKNHEIQYILSSDIEEDHPLPQSRDNIRIISPYQEIDIDDIKVKAYGSTDEGVSFLLHFNGINIFHAGDLNWWHWWEDTLEGIEAAEKMFKEEISLIKGEAIHIAFFPVDPRLEKYYALGAKYFIENVHPQILVPMHFGEDYKVIKQFVDEMRDCPTRILEISHEGQRFTNLLSYFSIN